MKYDVNYFIKKFKAIPPRKWCAHEFTDGRGRHCALGHCGESGEGDITKEASKLIGWFNRNGGLSVSKVNDGKDEFYSQETPKKRILAALREIKERSA
jgi:hypothetical protein